MKKGIKELERLISIVKELREKCPWDKKQTTESLRTLTIEEVYELSEAITNRNNKNIEEELGDLLLHVLFYAQMGSEKKIFNLESICKKISKKLIERHPHIYGTKKVKTAEEVKENWESIKLKEGKKSVLEGVPKSLPALVKANRIQEKVAGVGFDWEHPEQVFEKLKEELAELQHEVKQNDMDKMESEFGDVLFSMVNYARFLKINPENALERTNKKFIKRFQYLEQKAKEAGKTMSDMTLAEMDVFWEEAKQL